MGGDRDETHHGIQQQAWHGRDRAADSAVEWVRGFAPDASPMNQVLDEPKGILIFVQGIVVLADECSSEGLA